MKINVATLLALAFCLPTAVAQTGITDPAAVFRAQSPMMSPATMHPPHGYQYPMHGHMYPRMHPPMLAHAPRVGAPMPSYPVLPGQVPGVQAWNAFSPPTLPGANLWQDGADGAAGAAAGDPTTGVPATPQIQPAPYGQDPFLTQPQMGLAQPQPFTQIGANGPQPFRFGWQQRLNIHWITTENVSPAPAAGNFGEFGLDYEMQWTQQMPGWIYVSTPRFGMRAWEGPTGIGLPGNVFSFGWDLRMETPRNSGPYSFMLEFSPSFNTDFDGSLSSDAWNLDGAGAMFFQLDRYWMMMLGVQYWDRVDDRVLPLAGLIYTDDFWEWRLTFPEARVSLFLGSEYLWAKWLYVRGEYHVEAYEVSSSLGGMTRQNRIELEDWRLAVGLKMDTGYYDWFLEGGWVFDREIIFNSPTPGFNVGTGFMARVGVRF